jgi:hypothetical protein
LSLEFGVESVVCRIWGIGLRVWGFGDASATRKVWGLGLGFKVYIVWFGCCGAWLGVLQIGFCCLGWLDEGLGVSPGGMRGLGGGLCSPDFGVRVQGCELRVSSLRIQVSGIGLQLQGVGCRM